MVVSDQLKKQIVIEIIALIFLVGVIIYGMVIVIDYKGLKSLKKASDGEGLEGEGVSYTVTNNNSVKKQYELLIIPDVHNDSINLLTIVAAYKSGRYTYNYRYKYYQEGTDKSCSSSVEYS